MTPSEKKATEEWNRSVVLKESQLQDLLKDAERRGFERAKRMASKTLQDYECHYLIENLKYEDSHDEA